MLAYIANIGAMRKSSNRKYLAKSSSKQRENNFLRIRIESIALHYLLFVDVFEPGESW